jgi:hypothetical protein
MTTTFSRDEVIDTPQLVINAGVIGFGFIGVGFSLATRWR